MQKPYSQLTAAEKAALLVANDVYSFPHDDPNVAVDYCGLSGTITLSQFIDIINNTTIPLYFKITTEFLSGDGNYWSNTDATVGQVAAFGKTMFNWQPSRAVPAANITSNLRVKVSAYKDAGYTQLYGEDYTDFSYDFFNHTTGDVIDYSDFETGLDNWTAVKRYPYEYFAIRKTEYPYTGAWSLAMYGYADSSYTRNDMTDSTGQVIPSQSYYITKTFDTSNYTKAYLVFHVTRWKQDNNTPSWDYPVFRIWTDTRDYIVRAPLLKNTTGCYRIAVPIDTSESTTVRIAGLFYDSRFGSSEYIETAYIDGIIVVGF